MVRRVVRREAFQPLTRNDGVVHHLIPPPRCERCFVPTDGRYVTCPQCAFENPWGRTILERIVAGTLLVPDASAPHNDEVGALKERGEKAREHAFVLWVLLATLRAGRFDAVVPLPSSRDPLARSDAVPERTRLAGPYALAAEMAAFLKVPWYDALWFTRDVDPQKTLNRRERFQNMNDCMSSRYRFRPVRVLVVDDVCTTGASMFEAARALADAGAASCVGVAAARDSRYGYLPARFRAAPA